MKMINKCDWLSDVRILTTLLFFCLFGLVSNSAIAANPNKGSELYTQHCSSCHGVSGVSDMPNAPNFVQGDVLWQSDVALLNSIKSGQGAMPAYQGILSDQEILDLVAFLRTLN